MGFDTAYVSCSPPEFSYENSLLGLGDVCLVVRLKSHFVFREFCVSKISCGRELR